MSAKTRFLMMSDTHAGSIDTTPEADVAVHCGGLTKESKIDETRQAVQLLQNLKAPLKLVVAGNHDFTLDIPAFKEKIQKATQHIQQGYRATSHCEGDTDTLEQGTHTLLLTLQWRTAASSPGQPPWIVDINLPRCPWLTIDLHK